MSVFLPTFKILLPVHGLSTNHLGSCWIHSKSIWNLFGVALGGNANREKRERQMSRVTTRAGGWKTPSFRR